MIHICSPCGEVACVSKCILWMGFGTPWMQPVFGAEKRDVKLLLSGRRGEHDPYLRYSQVCCKQVTGRAGLAVVLRTGPPVCLEEIAQALYVLQGVHGALSLLKDAPGFRIKTNVLSLSRSRSDLLQSIFCVAAPGAEMGSLPCQFET